MTDNARGTNPALSPSRVTWTFRSPTAATERLGARSCADDLQAGDLVTLSGDLGARQDDARPRAHPRAGGRCRPGSAEPDLHPDADL